MKSETFGDYIRRAREARALPLRKVAARLDIDTSTLSKVERGERQALIDYLEPLADVLNLELKEVQTEYIVDKVIKDFDGLEYLLMGLEAARRKIQRRNL
jgi:transcriptional regulator with XRE-family HTH domain